MGWLYRDSALDLPLIANRLSSWRQRSRIELLPPTNSPQAAALMVDGLVDRLTSYTPNR